MNKFKEDYYIVRSLLVDQNEMPLKQINPNAGDGMNEFHFLCLNQDEICPVARVDFDSIYSVKNGSLIPKNAIRFGTRKFEKRTKLSIGDRVYCSNWQGVKATGTICGVKEGDSNYYDFYDTYTINNIDSTSDIKYEPNDTLEFLQTECMFLPIPYKTANFPTPKYPTEEEMTQKRMF